MHGCNTATFEDIQPIKCANKQPGVMWHELVTDDGLFGGYRTETNEKHKQSEKKYTHWYKWERTGKLKECDHEERHKWTPDES